MQKRPRKIENLWQVEIETVIKGDLTEMSFETEEIEYYGGKNERIRIYKTKMERRLPSNM